ncbi:hypothetical protein JXA63_05285 [Candidatus Woesebacteria bacterium]|nr:hypothetical protein [Candidatus Woesebacteria bacterium]
MKIKIFIILTVLFFLVSADVAKACEDRFWEVQSIDTMKYSRDLAREKLKDPYFKEIIEEQVEEIAETGATHVAIGTPYDVEFLPYIKVWVELARANNLKVWYRGNISGWEGWFNYPLITPEEHVRKVVQFIKVNPELFEDGDIFSSCPECENGVIGDPRSEVSVEDFRSFIVKEYSEVKKAFKDIDKDVKANYFSMNADVAYLVMDEDTTDALDGLVTVDHYIKDPKKYGVDIKRLVSRSGGNIVIGEFGAPIPDIHGSMSEEKQSEWIDLALSEMVNDDVVGVNYWTYTSSSTGIWTEGNRAKHAIEVVDKYFRPRKIVIKVENELGKVIKNARASLGAKTFSVNEDGIISILLYDDDNLVDITSENYKTQTFKSGDLTEGQVIVLIKEKENIFFRIGKFFVKTFINN